MTSSARGGAGKTRIGRQLSLRTAIGWLGIAAIVALPLGALAQPAPTGAGRPAASKRVDAAAATAKPGGLKLPVPVVKGAALQPTKPTKGAGSAAAAGQGQAATPPVSPMLRPIRWTAATPDQMVDLALARARRGGDDAIAGLLIASSLDERATFGRVRTGLRALSAQGLPLADDARWMMLSLTPDPASAPWPGAAKVAYNVPADPNGLVKSFAILGPFQDTGGGLARREGPEAEGQSFTDTQARYAWGAFDVSWRRTLPASSTARGVPLDLYIHPRSESCTYLASKVTIPADPAASTAAARPILIHVGATGAVRLLWDGAEAAMSEDIHPKLVLDRLAVRVDAAPGDHLVALKVCSSSVADEGRARVRFTDDKRKPFALLSSSDLRGMRLPSPPAARATKADAKAAKAKPKASGFERVPTLLEAAMDLPDGASPERTLTASIARTLGGADDGRSPRAPGLLDRVAKTPDISPDLLAITGWISPFGSNRSGWLNLARTRGAASGDPATAAFAQRRLAASHLGSGMADWALSTIREEPLRSAVDPEAKLIKAMAKRQLGGGGLGRAAVDDLTAITAEQKGRAPIAVWAEIASAARAQPQVALQAARRLAEMRPESRDSSFVSALRSESGAALETAAASSLAQQTSADDVIQIGRSLYDAGRFAWAREAFYLATQVAPNRAAAFQGLAAARRAAIASDKLPADVAANEASSATAAIERARDLEPSDSLMKAELAFRAGTPSNTGASEGPRPPASATANAEPSRTKMRDEQYLPAPAAFLDRARRSPAKKGEVFDRQLHWVRVVTYHPDKRVSQLMHYAREIVVEPRTEGELYERIPAETSDTELVLARLHRKDGTVVMPEEQSSGGGNAFIRWPELKTGDVVEVAVRSWTDGPVGRRGDAPFYFIDYVGSTDTHPVLYNEVVIDSGQGSPLAIDVIHGKADRVTNETRDGRSVQRLVWDNPPSIPEEPYAPSLAESLPVVVGSTFGSWSDFREWYRGAVSGFTEPDDQVKRLAEELTKGKKTRDEKIRAIFDYVADDIRYVNYVSGEWWLPNRPQQLLARRQGDCDDKAILMITLLRSVGIEATEVLVQTRYTGQPSLLRSEKAAIPIFDHGIAYLPGKNGAPGMWLDATSPQSRMGPLPSMDARAVALFVNEGPAKVIDTPAGSPNDHGVDAELTIQLSPSGAGDIKATERHSGDAAFELRTNLSQSDARAQWVEQYLAAGWLPTVQVKPSIDFKSDLPNGGAVLSYEARSEGLAQREGNELAVPISQGTTMTSQLAPLVKRTLPVVLPPGVAPGHQTRTITFVAPAGFVFADLPPGGEEAGGEFGSARLDFKRGRDPKTVVVTRTTVFDMSTIPVEKYAAWRGWLQRVDGLMHRRVRLIPAGSEEKAAETTAAKLSPPAELRGLVKPKRPGPPPRK